MQSTSKHTADMDSILWFYRSILSRFPANRGGNRKSLLVDFAIDDLTERRHAFVNLISIES